MGFPHLLTATVAFLPLVFGKEIPAIDIISQAKYSSGLVHETIMGLKRVSTLSKLLQYVD